MARAFRFGVSISGVGVDGAGWRDAARKAEDLGFDTFLVADHLRQGFQPMVALAAAAEATSSIRLGTFVINNDFRHPVLLAREAATLDVLSGGRFELGIGAGHSGDEYREAGIAFDAARVRVERLGESVRLMKRLWSERSVDFTGSHYTVSGHELFPKPVQAAIPVLVGGNGRDLLTLAATEADTVGFTGFWVGEDGRGRDFPHFTAASIANRVELVRTAAGAGFAGLELNVLVQGVETRKPRETAEKWAKELGVSPEEVAGSPFVLFGSESEIEEKLISYRERFGFSYIVTFGPGMDALAPVVARLRGT